jgi:hypothetical protein
MSGSKIATRMTDDPKVPDSSPRTVALMLFPRNMTAKQIADAINEAHKPAAPGVPAPPLKSDE